MIIFNLIDFKNCFHLSFMLYKIITIPIDLIACDRSSFFNTMKDMQKGKVSYSGSKPIDVFFVTDGKFKDKYIIKDGYHRFFALLLKGKKEVDVYIDEEGDYLNCYYAINQLFSIDMGLKYSGLEDLADESILEDIFPFL